MEAKMVDHAGDLEDLSMSGILAGVKAAFEEYGLKIKHYIEKNSGLEAELESLKAENVTMKNIIFTQRTQTNDIKCRMIKSIAVRSKQLIDLHEDGHIILPPEELELHRNFLLENPYDEIDDSEPGVLLDVDTSWGDDTHEEFGDLEAEDIQGPSCYEAVDLETKDDEKGVISYDFRKVLVQTGRGPGSWRCLSCEQGYNSVEKLKNHMCFKHKLHYLNDVGKCFGSNCSISKEDVKHGKRSYGPYKGDILKGAMDHFHAPPSRQPSTTIEEQATGSNAASMSNVDDVFTPESSGVSSPGLNKSPSHGSLMEKGNGDFSDFVVLTGGTNGRKSAEDAQVKTIQPHLNNDDQGVPVSKKFDMRRILKPDKEANWPCRSCESVLPDFLGLISHICKVHGLHYVDDSGLCKGILCLKSRGELQKAETTMRAYEGEELKAAWRQLRGTLKTDGEYSRDEPGTVEKDSLLSSRSSSRCSTIVTKKSDGTMNSNGKVASRDDNSNNVRPLTASSNASKLLQTSQKETQKVKDPPSFRETERKRRKISPEVFPKDVEEEVGMPWDSLEGNGNESVDPQFIVEYEDADGKKTQYDKRMILSKIEGRWVCRICVSPLKHYDSKDGLKRHICNNHMLHYIRDGLVSCVQVNCPLKDPKVCRDGHTFKAFGYRYDSLKHAEKAWNAKFPGMHKLLERDIVDYKKDSVKKTKSVKKNKPVKNTKHVKNKKPVKNTKHVKKNK